MKSALIAVLLLVSMAVSTSGQKSTSVAITHKANLDWLFKETQYLGEKDRLRVINGISPDERKALIEAISIQLRKGKQIGNAASGKKLLNDVLETRVKFIDLNGDGIPEVIVQGSGEYSCSPTGNCDFYVFMRSGNGYKLILEKGAVQTFTISSRRTSGFNDLVLGQHGSAYESGQFVYRFSDGIYRKGPCYNVSYQRLVGDEIQDLNEPDITPCNGDN
jgi:hypothetical protein